MSFFDEGDEPRTAIRSPKPPPRRPPARARRGGGPADDRTLLLRRAGAGAIALVLVIAIVLIVRAILNHQALAGLKNYNAEVTGIVQNELNSVRGPFFLALDGAGGSSNPTEVPTTLQGYVSVEAGYYHQAEGWSVPSQMLGAQTYFVEALGLRYEALQGIETQLPTALGTGSGQERAIKLIAGDMERLLAADVMYADRVKPLIQQALAASGIAGEVTPDSAFLPDVGWLQPTSVAQRILGFIPTSLGGAPTSGSPGHELLPPPQGVSVQASNGTTTPLSTTTANTFAYTPAGITFVLDVLNSGTLTEHGVQTKIYFYKAGLNTSCLTKTAQIKETVPGQTYLSPILITPATCPDPGAFFNEPLRMTAEVVPLPGETDTANNRQSYTVEFTN